VSSLWHFQSFSRRRFDAFVSNEDGRSTAMLSSLCSRDEFLRQHPQAHTVIERFPQSGLMYDELNAQQSEALDWFICALFGPLGLEDELELEFESPEGVAPVTIDVLLNRSAGTALVSILQVLKEGRRFGQTANSPCGYCLLTQSELVEIHNEIQQILKLQIPWPDPALPAKIYENLLAVFASIKSKQKECVALLG
jgi:hypothetical protein